MKLWMLCLNQFIENCMSNNMIYSMKTSSDYAILCKSGFENSAILYKATITTYLNVVLRPLLKFDFSKQTCFDSAVG